MTLADQFFVIRKSQFTMDESYLPLSYLNQLTYCPRRFWYMYVQGEIEINAPMLEGTFQHQTRADKAGTETDENGRIVHRRLWVWSDQLNIAGFADFVESDGSVLIPVEYKHGQQGKWDNDQIQLCAQALCLEEMTGQHILHGEIFYWRSRRRVTIPCDEALRQATHQAIRQAHQLLAENTIPSPVHERQKCNHCSIQPICLPCEVVQLQQLQGQ